MRGQGQPRPTLRRATAEDGPAVSAVDAAAWRTSYAPYLPLELVESWLVRIPYIWRRGLEGKIPHYIVRIAQLPNGKVAGFCAIERTRLWSLQIHPDYQGQGIGTILFEDAAAHCGPGLYTHVLRESQRACAFFEHRGLRPIAEIKDVYLDVEVPMRVYGR